MAGEIKLMEAWKAINIPSYPFQMEENEPNRLVMDRSVRQNTIKKWKTQQKQKQQEKA